MRLQVLAGLLERVLVESLGVLLPLYLSVISSPLIDICLRLFVRVRSRILRPAVAARSSLVRIEGYLGVYRVRTPRYCTAKGTDLTESCHHQL